jgi:sec-independent protein translocase protein TatA
MMGLDNPIHIAFLLIVLLLVFGAKRLPEMGHSLGSGLRGFKEAIGGETAHLSAPDPITTPAPVSTPVQEPQAQPVTVQVAPSVSSVPDDRAA